MIERNATKRLKGDVQLDDAYLGGRRSGTSVVNGRSHAKKNYSISKIYLNYFPSYRGRGVLLSHWSKPIFKQNGDQK